jgi:hypothetical protein
VFDRGNSMCEHVCPCLQAQVETVAANLLQRMRQEALTNRPAPACAYKEAPETAASFAATAARLESKFSMPMRQVPGDVFRFDGTPQGMMSTLNRLGAVLLPDNHGLPLTDAFARALEAIATRRGRSAPIFQAGVPGETDAEGLPKMSVENGQRQQFKLDDLEGIKAPHADMVRTTLAALKKHIQEQVVDVMNENIAMLDSGISASAQQASSSQTATFGLYDGVVITSHSKNGEPVEAQATHADVPPSFVKDFNKWPGGFLMCAIDDDTTLQLAPGSHEWVREYEQRAASAPASTSSQQQEPRASEYPVTAFMPTFEAVRVVLKRGQMLLVHGFTVHAGDEGQRGATTTLPRVHFYIMRNDLRFSNHTYLLSTSTSPEFLAKFPGFRAV